MASAAATSSAVELHGNGAGGELRRRDVRVGDGDRCSEGQQLLGDAAYRRLPGVAGVGLVGHAGQQDAPALDRQLALVQSAGDPLDDVVGHVVVDVVGQLDEAERLAQALADLPRQVAGVDGKAVAPDARARCELHEAERLGVGGLDDVPDVDAEAVGVDGQFVDERDVDVAERVLEQLGQLGLSGPSDGDGLVDELIEEPLHPFERRGVDARHDLGGVLEGVGDVAGVDAFGAVAEMEVGTDGQAGPGFEDGGDELLGGARIGGGLEDHGGAGSQVRCEHLGGRLHEGEHRVALVQRRRHRDDAEVEPGQVGDVGGGPESARVERGPQLGVGDVLDVGLRRRRAR